MHGADKVYERTGGGGWVENATAGGEASSGRSQPGLQPDTGRSHLRGGDRRGQK